MMQLNHQKAKTVLTPNLGNEANFLKMMQLNHQKAKTVLTPNLGNEANFLTMTKISMQGSLSTVLTPLTPFVRSMSPSPALPPQTAAQG